MHRHRSPDRRRPNPPFPRRSRTPWLLALFLTVLPAWLASATWGQSGAPVLTLHNADAGGQSDEYLSISLANGRGVVVDRLERDPLNLRSRALHENLFQLIGRASDQPATVGEIFFAPISSSDGSVRSALYVETPIGYAAYFEDPGRGLKLGQITTLTSRPFEDIAATDRNFALLMRSDSTGRTEGAYLYHATSGKAIYMDGLRRLEITPRARPTSALPALAGPVTAVEIFAGSEATASYVVLDSASGEIHFLNPSSGAAVQITATRSDIGLYDEVFGREAAHTSPRRFVAVPVNQSLSQTEHVFIADAVTGDLAVLEYVINPNLPMQLRKAKVSLSRRFSNDGGERVLATVPRVTTTGVTIGVWIIDSQTGRTVYVDRPGLAAEMTVSPVSIELR